MGADKIREGSKGLTIGLTIVIASTLLVACAPPTPAQPTADYVGVEDNSGDQGTYVVVPVTLTNVQDGLIISIIFDLYYNTSVIEVVGVQKGSLTSSWDSPTINTFAGGTRVSLVYDAQAAHALQNGSTGSIALLNFSVGGEPGETSMMNLTNIQLADNGYNVGTAPAKNGTFSISTGSEPTPMPLPTEPSVGGDGGNGGARAPHATDDIGSKPTSMPTITPSVTPPVRPPVTISPTPIPSPSQTPALRQPGFEALVTIACLVAVVYLLRRRKRPP
ncbi:MAG: cohesin domain-containing protein [Euryarchaeota archaeon]|nr:cohesin domain-containing protein [Euryarchaeota archaeon]